jgi:hypothetical protein
MKTPWRFLRDLTSRKKLSSPEAQLSLPDTGSNRGDPESEIVPAPLASDGEEQARPDVQASVLADLPQADEPSDQPVKSPEPTLLAPAPVDSPIAAGSQPTDAKTRTGTAPSPSPDRNSESTPSQARRKTEKRDKRTASSIVVESAFKHKDGQPVEAMPQAVPEFFDEVAGLEDEISQLRVVLAGKLTLQNAQLRKMLERFDVS